jgi:hypothetical protein
VSRMLERRHLPLSADAVAALVLDWSRDPSWRGAVRAMEVDPPGRARRGQRIRETLRFAGLRFITATMITAADATSASFAGGSGVVAVAGRRSVVPDEHGCTVVLEVDVALTGVLAVLTPLLAPGYRRRHAADADALVARMSPARAVA